MRCPKAVFFYDEDQSIKPSDVRKEDFDKLKDHVRTKIEQLRSQFRVRGGRSYVDFVKNLLNSRLRKEDKPFFKNYEFMLFNSIREMIGEIKAKEKDHELARLVAGYAWPWISKNDKTALDIRIDGVELRWNSVSNDWFNSSNALEEVGCIHTVQGYDINYTGVIFGEEIS